MKIPVGLGSYEIKAHLETVNEVNEGGVRDVWPGVVLLPTFYLYEAVEGVDSPVSAAAVARRILDPLSVHGARLHIKATRKSTGEFWVSPTSPLQSISGITWHERKLRGE